MEGNKRVGCVGHEYRRSLHIDVELAGDQVFRVLALVFVRLQQFHALHLFFFGCALDFTSAVALSQIFLPLFIQL